MRKYFLAFIAFMFVEIAGFIVVGNWIGVMPTLLLIIFTSVIGGFLLKKQGTKAMQDMKSAGASGQAPGVTLIDGVLVFIGSIMLILPGFVTDLIGLILITPIRKLLMPVIFKVIRQKMKNGQMIIVQK